jgi:hypothetical protein
MGTFGITLGIRVSNSVMIASESKGTETGLNVITSIDSYYYIKIISV